ncbi:MAG: beta-lactamase family protein [Leptospiraceae bacterium]|nr:beta-lactamase family protein [Leptospiraceae bacterium]MCP5497458.1 beta-lactamase family protein [Leptospiraceae bacterium]
MGKLKILVLAFIILFFGCSKEEPPKKPVDYKNESYQYTKNYLNWFIKNKMKESDIVGLSLAIVDDQKVIWSEGFGYANKHKSILTNAKTVYNIGSISKIFTASAIMQLAERGKIDIDKPIQTYLKNFSIKSRFSDSKPIVARTILTHHSGLPSDRLKDFLYTNNPPSNYEKMFMDIPSSLKEEYVANPPNTVFSYSNLGYSTLGVLIAKTSGIDYEEYIKKNLFEPLNMGLSDFRKNELNQAMFSEGYESGKKVPFPIIRDIPAGSINSNVLELSNFVKMVFANGTFEGKQVIHPATLSEMTKVQNTEVPLDMDFKIGLGYWIHHIGGKLAIFHGGDLPPFHAFLMMLPEEKIGAVVLVNSGNNTIDGTLWEIVSKSIELTFEEKFNNKLPIAKNDNSSPTPLTNDELNNYAGNYATMMGLIKVERSGNKLKINLFNTNFELMPMGIDLFFLEYKILGIIPIEIEALKNLSLSFQKIRNEIVLGVRAGDILIGMGTKIQSSTIPESWKKRIGKYKVLNQTNSDPIRKFEIEYNKDENLLLVKVSMKLGTEMEISAPIKPVSTTEAILMGKGRNLGETIRVTNNHPELKELLEYSGYQFQKSDK